MCISKILNMYLKKKNTYSKKCSKTCIDKKYYSYILKMLKVYRNILDLDEKCAVCMNKSRPENIYFK